MTTETITDAATKVCPNCGEDVPPGGTGLGRTFCSAACRRAFNNRTKAEGAVMASLVKAWVLNRHAKPGTREAEVCSNARRELTEIARIFLDNDEAAGRPPITAYVGEMLETGRYIDRTRKA
jgi:hypothetical protein